MDNDHHSLSLLDKPRSLKKTLVNTLKLRKQRSTGDISEGATRHTKFSSSMRSTRSFASQNSTLSVESNMTSTSKHTDYSDDQSFYSQVRSIIMSRPHIEVSLHRNPVRITRHLYRASFKSSHISYNRLLPYMQLSGFFLQSRIFYKQSCQSKIIDEPYRYHQFSFC